MQPFYTKIGEDGEIEVTHTRQWGSKAPVTNLLNSYSNMFWAARPPGMRGVDIPRFYYFGMGLAMKAATIY